MPYGAGCALGVESFQNGVPLTNPVGIRAGEVAVAEVSECCSGDPQGGHSSGRRRHPLCSSGMDGHQQRMPRGANSSLT